MDLEELVLSSVLGDFSKEYFKAAGENWSQSKQFKVVQLLRNKMPDSFMFRQNQYESKFQLFMDACASGNLHQIKAVFKEYPISQLIQSISKQNLYPVHIACISGHISVLEYLKDHGFDLCIRDSSLRCILHLAAIKDDLQLVEYILKVQQDLTNIRDIWG